MQLEAKTEAKWIWERLKKYWISWFLVFQEIENILAKWNRIVLKDNISWAIFWKLSLNKLSWKVKKAITNNKLSILLVLDEWEQTPDIDWIASAFVEANNRLTRDRDKEQTELPFVPCWSIPHRYTNVLYNV